MLQINILSLKYSQNKFRINFEVFAKYITRKYCVY